MGLTREQIHSVVGLANRRPPSAGATRVIAIDGPSGAGKTTIAAALADESGGHVVHMDHIYPGWDGLDAGARRLVEDVLVPLAEGRPAEIRRWDWDRHREAGREPVPASPLLVVEGTGSGSRAAQRHISVLVWVDAPPHERRRRALARDGDVFAPHWDRWAAQERTTFRREATRSRADVVIQTGDEG